MFGELIHPAVRKRLLALERERQRLHSQSFDLYNLERAMKECGIDDYYTMVYSSVEEASVTFDISHISDATPVLKALARLGYRQYKPMEKPTDNAMHEFRWFLEHPRGTRRGQIEVCGKIALAKDDDPLPSGCRLVKVGEETFTRPTFEVRCDPPLEAEVV